jgi:NADP-dependent 3-hydroxy acid dehydrogenase YdfG
MNRIKGKKVFITGASAGIGQACARAFASRGATLILCARRVDRLDALGSELEAEHGTRVRVGRLDVRDAEAVDAFVADVVGDGEVPDVLVNNAGLARDLLKIQEGRRASWDEMIDTNVKGLLYVTRAVLPHMIARDSGHIVNIGSVAGRQVYPSGNVYNATKFAVFALNQAMAIDLVGTNIRVSTVDPGAVHSEFSDVRFFGDTERAETVYEGYRPLQPEDIADAVCYVVNTPEHVNVQEMLVMPTDQRNPYVIHKEG